MRAVQFMEYGGPEVLKMRSIPDVVGAAGDVLVHVRATTVNAHDVFVRSGRMRPLTGNRFPLGIGVDFAGHVISPGSGPFAIGDPVWGTLRGFAHRGSGAAAELVAVPANQLGRAPVGVELHAAAAIVAGGTAALTGLRGLARVQAGNRVLVRGASGSVGNAAVQYAHYLGAYVTALASFDHQDLVLRLGADRTYDYHTTTTTQLGQYDVIFDTAGTQLGAYRRLLQPGGRMVTVAASSAQALLSIAGSTLHGPRRIRTFLGRPDTTLLDDLALLVTNESIVPLMDTTYLMEDIAEAHHRFESGGSRGKHVILPNW